MFVQWLKIDVTEFLITQLFSPTLNVFSIITVVHLHISILILLFDNRFCQQSLYYIHILLVLFLELI